MKTLYLIRHAKSSWEDLSLSDFDRPLNERGKRDAPRIGKRLKEKKVTPDLILSSPAKRALSTCKRISKILFYPEKRIVTDSRLYHASEDSMLNVVHEISDDHDVVMIFGHNPGFTDFLNSLTDQHIMNVPTCGVASCSFNVDTWKEVTWHIGKMDYYDYPKSRSDD